ncbi:hypothetical protein SARC_11278 [Sphaeroforma arctica JP610]|uniref:Uncharacterized protein n=1 Tax=Sphaeroforma arctica JP610 TaxID=667725 RepID=A0A0L0FHG0_9EUKA|nr:hypothetical protein SARC_11278 [Sphaeroforma arctica JP610]KNC76209.1 hypothetical protein SARC_11278 [Sphaeroforma arctica JP610]|eukprot:XP_014150111.1 hypothetical protein SARC_11278 [Sphaeroforma arctica JP610]
MPILDFLALSLSTEKYANTKICNGLAGETTLAQMPQLKACFEESYRQLDRMIAFTAAVEDRLNVHLRHGTIPDADLVEKLAVCKIKCIDVATQRVHALRQEVGSYALMWDTGFELVDMLLTCKFAEGDSRILQQKLARDRLKRVQKGGVGGMVGDVFSTNSAEAIAAISLARKLAPAGRDLQKMAAALDVNWRELYGLSDMICERHINSTQGSKFIEPCVERLRASSNEYDHDWKSKLGSSTIPSASSARA